MKGNKRILWLILVLSILFTNILSIGEGIIEKSWYP